MRTEDLIFSQLITNEEYARRVMPHLRDEYFQQKEDKALFKIYSRYFTKHNGLPSKQALLVEIENLKGSAELYAGLKNVISSTVEFTESLKYLMDATEKFCKDQAIYNALRESVLIADGQSKMTPDAIPSILTQALSICFDTQVGHDYLTEAELRWEYYHSVEARIPTGSVMFDKITGGGFPRKTLNILLAPPHGGKSFVMSNFSVGALLAGYNVLYISAEMSEFEIGLRHDLNMMGVDTETLKMLSKPVFNNKFKSVIEKSRGVLKIKEFPTGASHCGHFRSLLQDLKTKQNFVPDLIIVDYMGIVASEKFKPSSGANSYTIQKSVGEELRALAIETNCAVITAVQTNRSGVGNTDVDMTSTSESLGTPMIADWFCAIINTDDLKQMKQLMFRQLKNRYKSLDDPNKFMMGVDYSKMRMYDLDNPSVEKAQPQKGSGKMFSDEIWEKSKISESNTTFDDFSYD